MSMEDPRARERLLVAANRHHNGHIQTASHLDIDGAVR